MNWVEKYRPKKFEDLKGQEEAVKKIKFFMSNFNIGNLTKRIKKALVFYGPPGVGKTTLAQVLAKENNLEIFELNASDLRNKDKLKEILRPAIEQQSLIKKGKVILVDEVDGISGYYDRGGIPELLSLIETTSYPIIITANDVWKKSLSLLRKKTELVQLKEIPYGVLKQIMIDILQKEGKFVEGNMITKIAVNAKGDVRAALNDLQTIACLGEFTGDCDERNKETDIFNALKHVFKDKPTNALLRIYDSVNLSIDEIILWVEENIPNEYQGEELARAIEMLSKADLFKGRIYKQQYWRFLVYENIFLSYGISASKREVKQGFTIYKRPTRILKIWLNNQRTFKKKSIAKKYARYVHVGEKRAMNEFATIKSIINSNPKIQKELKLDEEEISYLASE